MRLPVHCPTCLRRAAGATPPRVLVPIEGAGFGHGLCTAGHRFSVILEERRHEWLFETGLCAMAESRHREAVSNILSALGDFYEYATEVYGNACGAGGALDSMAWRVVSRHPDRRLGAYVAAHMFTLKAAPTVLTTEMLDFVDEVEHMGRVPTTEESEQFGDAVMEVILTATARIRRDHPVSQAAVDAQVRKRLFLQLPADVSGAVRPGYPMALRDLEVEQIPPNPTRHHVERLSRWLRRTGSEV